MTDTPDSTGPKRPYFLRAIVYPGIVWLCVALVLGFLSMRDQLDVMLVLAVSFGIGTSLGVTIIGMPLHALLVWRRWFRLVHYLIAGGLVGIGFAALQIVVVLSTTSTSTAPIFGPAFILLAIFAAFGGITAAIVWSQLRPDLRFSENHIDIEGTF